MHQEHFFQHTTNTFQMHDEHFLKLFVAIFLFLNLFQEYSKKYKQFLLHFLIYLEQYTS